MEGTPTEQPLTPTGASGAAPSPSPLALSAPEGGSVGEAARSSSSCSVSIKLSLTPETAAVSPQLPPPEPHTPHMPPCDNGVDLSSSRDPPAPAVTDSSPPPRPVGGGRLSTAPCGPSTSAPLRSGSSQHTARLSDIQLSLQRFRQAREGNTLMSRYLLSNSLRRAGSLEARTELSMADDAPGAAAQRLEEVRSVEELQRRVATGHSGGMGPAAPRFKNKQVFRRKLVLLGYQEVGKTSLRKCFESEPIFFKRLPDVRTTTGVEVRETRMYVEGEDVELTLSDFAGQEAYHSHTYFLTNRSIFGLVWKISAIEQDFNSSGINAREEERLYKWIAEVYAKFPRSRIVLIATHLDELRVQGQRSVEMILNKVEGKVRGFLDRIAGSATTPRGGARSLQDILVGNFAVSCKTRRIIAAGDRLRHMTGGKISSLLAYISQVAKDDCMADREYPSAAIPGRHARLIQDVEQLKKEQPKKLLMTIEELVHMAVRLGVESDAELLQAARLMHSWDVVYLLNPHRIADNLFVMLHPRWLSRMAAALFSYAHVQRTPLHLRSFIAGLEYTISQAEAEDMFLMRKGYLRWPLARVLFHRPLADFLKRTPDDSDISMCVQLLEAMNILYPVDVVCDDFNVLMEESPVEPEVGRPVIKEKVVRRYYVPALSPQSIPSVLKRVSPVLLHRGVRVKMQFNFLPDELWWRLQSRLSAYIQEVTVNQPYCPTLEAVDDDEQALLYDAERLKEADDEHNRWKDAMWLHGPQCRVLMFRESLTTVSISTGETAARASEAVMQAIEDAVAELLDEYQGVHRTTFVACPAPGCRGWLPTEVVASSVTVTCETCRGQFDSASVVVADTAAGGPRSFSDALIAEVGQLLSYCLTYESSLHLCEYLGIPYRGPVPERARVSDSGAPADAPALPTEAHVEYLHALDKVVQAALFRAWMERVEERERRRRMLDTDPSPAFY